ncbi:hypothetical protein SPBR_04296 [Sporothrix brasiliensis 5110]|uniref:C2H2-type domain-containing protein n=1 Tax=Sporothrix brasiliensis 5110 TaxID=1398154 RepID=A0A0C2J9Y6_9PEZI|nr:uncharacterized protein SPBR_04296 [Sporothrix brasiliensis 5110]KIH93727.1 hypothetical protein SPBR_04296 [Sporothrix brasiliensis 5110]
MQRPISNPAMPGYQYADRGAGITYNNSPQQMYSVESPSGLKFGRDFSKSTTPSLELPCRMRSDMRLKRPTSESEDDEEQEDGSGKKARLSDNPASPVVFEFACPFYKRNRHKYCHQRSCRTSGWPSVHRVKEHLYRHHMHYVCDRCSTTFKLQENLREHLRQEVACAVSTCSVAEDTGFDLEIEKKLRSRKKIDCQNESDKWTHMYRLLFPSYRDKNTPSPYVDYSLRDEPLVAIAGVGDSDSTPYLPEADQGSLMTVAAAAVAVEQKITATETNSQGTKTEDVLIGLPSVLKGKGRPEQSTFSNMPDESRLVPNSAFYKIVQDHVLTVLSNIPNAPVPPSAKAQ